MIDLTSLRHFYSCPNVSSGTAGISFNIPDDLGV